MKSTRILSFLVCAVLLAGMTLGAVAETPAWKWNRRVEIMIPASEGGGLDTTIRKFKTYLEPELGTTVSVINKSGSVGITGFTWSYNSTNDGFAFQFTAPTAVISDAQGLFEGFKLMDVLIPVSGLVMAEGMLFSRKNAPWADAAGLVEYAKANPEKVTVAVDSPNGISGAILSEFEQQAGIKLKWITSGSAEGYISVIAGDIDLCINTWSDVGAYVNSGDLVATLVMADERNAAYPDVVTTGELGYDSTLGYYRVFTALAGTPEAAIESFAAAVVRASENPEWQEWLALNGMTNEYVWTAEELAQVLKNTYEKAQELSAQQ
ncbi:MAG TPA: tripartite tricarboxylate transporter substrate binding protein [Candidatus Limnocylindria bacterium]|nr:tripartite tricarboxylate transporter substrate binding protein [Candidatus Limnocylindria bacterium]